MAVDKPKINFSSDINYLKRSSFCGNATLTLPAVGGSVSTTVTHSLGYVPMFEVVAEIDDANTIWTGGKVSTLTDQAFLSGLGTDPTYVDLRCWSTTTTLTITLLNNTSPTATGTRKVYWIIYEDYGNV